MSSEEAGKALRRAPRREILDEFSFYICVPKLGFARHVVNDISEIGIGFTIDTLGEFKMAEKERYELHFYLNQSLFIPLQIEVMRLKELEHHHQNVGAVFHETGTIEFQAFLTLVKLVDQLEKVGMKDRP